MDEFEWRSRELNPVGPPAGQNIRVGAPGVGLQWGAWDADDAVAWIELDDAPSAQFGERCLDLRLRASELVRQRKRSSLQQSGKSSTQSSSQHVEQEVSLGVRERSKLLVAPH